MERNGKGNGAGQGQGQGLVVIQYPGGEGCRGCGYCCWMMDVSVEPGYRKPSREACRYLSSAAECQLHGMPSFPETCGGYICPHLLLESDNPEWYQTVRWPGGGQFPYRIYRPDVFWPVLREFPEATGVMPAVPKIVPLDVALAAVRRTKAIMVLVPDKKQRNGGGEMVVVHHCAVLHRLEHNRIPGDELFEDWNRLLLRYQTPEWRQQATVDGGRPA